VKPFGKIYIFTYTTFLLHVLFLSDHPVLYRSSLEHVNQVSLHSSHCSLARPREISTSAPIATVADVPEVRITEFIGSAIIISPA
jgi:hypothetical protein